MWAISWKRRARSCLYVDMLISTCVPHECVCMYAHAQLLSRISPPPTLRSELLKAKPTQANLASRQAKLARLGNPRPSWRVWEEAKGRGVE